MRGIYEQGVIHIRLNKSIFLQSGRQFRKPTTWNLAETIKRFVKQANVIRTRRLMHTFSARSLYKNTLCTSIWWIFQPLITAIETSVRIVTNFATREKVSKKSSPSTCVLPRITKHALYRSMDPSDLSLILYTHLHPKAFLETSKVVSFHVPFISRGTISSFIAKRHRGYLIASENLVGQQGIEL